MVAIIGFAAMLALIAARMPVGLAMLAVGSVGLVYMNGWGPFVASMKTNPYEQFASPTLAVIPLFILMGAFAERSGMARDLFSAARVLVGHLKGGLAMSVLFACTIFGAICGSSVATTATFGRAALPEFRRYRYDDGFSTATIAIGGVVDLLIPPSIILVVYAIATEQNIIKLFKAALIPGLLAVLFYSATIAILVRLNPEIAPTSPKSDRAEILPALMLATPAVLVIAIVIAGIYGGVFAPHDAAAVGCIAMLAVGLLQGRFGWSEMLYSLLQTAETTAMIFMILLGAAVFNAFLGRTQLPTQAAEFVSGLGLQPILVMAVFMLFYLLLGAVMDELAMLFLTLPVFFPVVKALDFGMPPDEVAIWFGVCVLIVVGIGLTAPPMGLNVFVVSAIAKDVPIVKTYRAILPFVAADVLRLAIMIAFPWLSLVLVRL